METVTISLEKFEQMTKHIAELEIQLQKKVIVKEVYPHWLKIIIFLVITVCFAYATW